jgi:hypothetical protein
MLKINNRSELDMSSLAVYSLCKLFLRLQRPNSSFLEDLSRFNSHHHTSIRIYVLGYVNYGMVYILK